MGFPSRARRPSVLFILPASDSYIQRGSASGTGGAGAWSFSFEAKLIDDDRLLSCTNDNAALGTRRNDGNILDSRVALDVLLNDAELGTGGNDELGCCKDDPD